MFTYAGAFERVLTLQESLERMRAESVCRIMCRIMGPSTEKTTDIDVHGLQAIARPARRCILVIWSGHTVNVFPTV